MANIGYYICVPFALLTKWFYTITNSYGVALILFTLVVKLVILPFQFKSKKSMIRMNRMQGKMKDIQTRYANNKEKQNEAIAELYAQEGISPMSGCLWSFLPLPILIVLYYIIRTPLRYFMLLSTEAIEKITNAATSFGYEAASGQTSAYEQIYLAKFIHENWEKFTDLVKEFPKLIDLDYQFLGMDLATTAKDAFAQYGLKGGWSVIGVLLLPFIAAGIQFVMSAVTMKAPGQQANQSSKMMMYMFPLMTLWMGFMFPAALCVYWIANAAFSAVQEVILNKFFGQKIEEEETEKEKAKREARIAKFEEQKKLMAMQQQAKNQKAKPVKKKSEEKKESGTNENGRIENRPYARGRSYSENRYDDK